MVTTNTSTWTLEHPRPARRADVEMQKCFIVACIQINKRLKFKILWTPTTTTSFKHTNNNSNNNTKKHSNAWQVSEKLNKICSNLYIFYIIFVFVILYYIHLLLCAFCWVSCTQAHTCMYFFHIFLHAFICMQTLYIFGDCAVKQHNNNNNTVIICCL